MKESPYFTTQYMEEADKLCRQLAIIDTEVRESGSPAELKSEVGADSIKLALENDTGMSKEQLNSRAKEILTGINGVINIIVSEEG